MRLRWDWLLGSILFFGIFFFAPLLEAVGSTQITIIICTGLILLTLIKIVEYSTEHIRCNCEDEDNDNEDNEDDDEDEDKLQIRLK